MFCVTYRGHRGKGLVELFTATERVASVVKPLSALLEGLIATEKKNELVRTDINGIYIA